MDLYSASIIMKKIIAFFILMIFAIGANAQKKNVSDSLNKLISTATEDTVKARLYSQLGNQYSNSRPDTALLLQEKAMQFAQSAHSVKLEAMIFNNEGIAYYNTGNYPKALTCNFAALKLNESPGRASHEIKNLYNIASIYDENGEQRQGIRFALKDKALAESIHDKKAIAYALSILGDLYTDLKMRDSALFYQQQAYRFTLKLKDAYLADGAALNLGSIYAGMNKPDTALDYYRKAVFYQVRANDQVRLSMSLLKIAMVLKTLGQPDSSIYYARKAMGLAMRGHFTRQSLSISFFLAGYFKDHGRLDSAFYYQGINMANRDSLYNWQKLRQVMQMGYAERDRENAMDMQAAAYRAAIRFYIVLVALTFLLVLAAVFWYHNHKNKQAKTLLQKQKEQIKATLCELETTQNQLVQAAKMASLGELTAGIAHEIQNPLNFVKNFSEVSVEMIGELDEVLERGDIAEARLVTGDIKQNLEKICYHGGRADSIVKGMLEHSRTASGQKEPTDLNLLVDEFLRLSYHGMRAKDKSFNAELITNFDEKLPNVKVVPQDIGRVLLNLFNNAFYAIQQKAKTTGLDYKPTVEVRTFLLLVKNETSNGQEASEIKGWCASIKDNGTGIPEKIRNKIMQPFFTTKPAGEGTGLGLSLSYDIIVKGHGGKFDVNSQEGSGSEFLISMPI